MEALAAAPLNLRETLVACIDQEIANATAGLPAKIWLKMNALVDAKMIDKLYAASAAGVKVVALVRGFAACALRCQACQIISRCVPWLADIWNIPAFFALPMARKCPAAPPKVFISSADWMPRNLNGRVETLVPIINETVHAQILDQVMAASVRDTTNTWLLQNDGTYARVPLKSEGVEDGKKAFSAHSYFMNNPSLSGRGSALGGKRPKSL